MAQRKPILAPATCFDGSACVCALFLGLAGPAATQERPVPDVSEDPEPAVIQTPVGPVPVRAEPGPTDPAEGVDTDEDSAEEEGSQAELITRLEAQIELRELFDDEEYSDAVPVAERVVTLTQEEFGEISSESAVAVSNLAEVQRRAGQYEDAGQNFLASVEIFREAEGEFTESVITPLVGLGASYQALRQYPQAVTVFEEARTVNRRVFGLLNEDQIVILDHLANTMLSMQQYEEAEQQKLAAVRIMERTYGTDTLEILPTLYRHALWLRRGYRFSEERDYYSRAMGIIREIEGRDSILLVRPLREVGNSFRAQKLPEGRGVSSLKRALEILQAEPDPDKLQMAEVLRDLGDWSVAFSKVGPTGNEYREAWALLNEVEDGERLQRRWFLEPDYVLRENPSTRGLADPGTPGALDGHVLVVFDVTPNGRTTNISILESEPPGLKDESTARSIARSRFRPRMVDGEIVHAQGIARNFTFLYEPTLEEE